jgi:hypothetical protein
MANSNTKTQPPGWQPGQYIYQVGEPPFYFRNSNLPRLLLPYALAITTTKTNQGSLSVLSHTYVRPLGPEGWSVKHPWRLRVTTNTQRTSAAPWPNAELGIRSLNEGRLNVLYCLEGRSFNKAAPALRRKPLSLNSKLNCFSHSDDIVTRSRAIAFSSEEGFEKLPLIRIKKVR